MDQIEAPSVDCEVYDEGQKPSNILAPFNPISESAMKVALDLLHLGTDDVLFDLGAGDGRLLIHAVQAVPGLRCVGIELDSKFVHRAEQSIKQQLAGEVGKRIQIRLGDALAADLVRSTETTTSSPCDELTIHDASAIFLFLVPNGLKLILPLLNRVVDRHKVEGRRLRVVAYMFLVPGWDPTEVNRNTKAGSPVYLYDFV